MVSMDAFASAFGFDAKSDDVWTTLGKVTAISADGKLSVLLGGSATPAECEAYCVADVGDVVFVAISKGVARAIARRGGDGDGGEYLPITGGTLTGELEIRHNNIDNKQTNNGISANTWPVDVQGIDKNGLSTSFFGEAVYTNGDVAAGIFSYNHDTTGAQVSTNYITVGSKKDGTRYFTVGDKAAFLTALGIGTVKELDVSSNVSVATSTDKSLGSLTLEAGKWVVEYGTYFSSASSGIACTYLYTSKDTAASSYWYRATCVQTAVSGSRTWHQGSVILNLTASTTVYLTVWHNTGSAKDCTGQMRAIKVG